MMNKMNQLDLYRGKEMKLAKKMKEEGIECNELVNSEDYQKFLETAFKCSDSVLMTYNKSIEKFDQSIWNFLKDSVIAAEVTRETAVTAGPTVLLLQLRIDDAVKTWLREKNNIYDFPQNGKECLDGLCFVKNGEIVFASCTHERFHFMTQEMYSRLKDIT